MNRAWIAGVFALLAAAGFVLADKESQFGVPVQIVPGVWFVEGDEPNYGHCNNIIIEMQDYLIMVDANFPSGARLAQAAAKRVSAKPVKFVFDTHHHGDHAFGNTVWTSAGATTFAYAGVVEEMIRVGPQGWRNAQKERKDMADLHRDTPEPPLQTFRKSPYVIEDASRRVEFHHFGWAHTRGDGLVYLPREKVLCTGDVVVNGPFNVTANANIGNWPGVISEAEKLDVQYVLSGHGKPGGKALLRGQSLFLAALKNAVRTSIEQGKKLDDLVIRRDGKLVARGVELPGAVKNWVGDEFLGRQVRDTYEELTQGKPRGDLVLTANQLKKQ